MSIPADVIYLPMNCPGEDCGRRRLEHSAFLKLIRCEKCHRTWGTIKGKSYNGDYTQSWPDKEISPMTNSTQNITQQATLPTCTRRLQFCAGHRIMGHENKCAHLHGHNYVAFFTAQGTVDSIGRVIDFSLLKGRIGHWIDGNWDHGFILHKDDVDAVDMMQSFTTGRATNDGEQPQKLYLMPINPTAENMAQYLLNVICPNLFKDMDVNIVEVTIWETENCSATAKVPHG